MVVAGSVSAYFGALAVAAVGRKPEIVHGHGDSALHRLQSIANVGQRTRDDHAHRIVEIRLAHFRFDINGKKYGCVCFVCHVPSVPVVHVAPGHEKSYSFIPSTCSTIQAFTESNASAVFVNRRAVNSASAFFKKASRSRSLRNSTATPCWLSGAPVGVARNSLTVNPLSPGNVVQPS